MTIYWQLAYENLENNTEQDVIHLPVLPALCENKCKPFDPSQLPKHHIILYSISIQDERFVSAKDFNSNAEGAF